MTQSISQPTTTPIALRPALLSVAPQVAPLEPDASSDPTEPLAAGRPVVDAGAPLDPSLALLALTLRAADVDRADAFRAAQSTQRDALLAGDRARTARARSSKTAARAERAAKPRKRWMRRLVKALTGLAAVASAVCTGGATAAIAAGVAAASALAGAGRRIATSVLSFRARGQAISASTAGLDQKRAASAQRAATDRFGEAQRATRHAVSTYAATFDARAATDRQLLRPEPR